MLRTMALALLLAFPPQPELLSPILGEPSSVEVREGQTLLDIAFEHRLGFQQLERLNPDVHVWIPEPGTIVQLPTQLVLPSVAPVGIVINIPEMRLYDFRVAGGPEVLSVAVGDAVDPTPTGEFRVGRKRTDPTWYVPESIRLERPELPPSVPPGPENPLGERWMTIGVTSYGIHGTNNRWSIGHDATHGCVRLYNEDMAPLYDRTPEGTPLRIVYQTVKLGQLADGIYVEAHPDLYALEPEAARFTLMRLFLFGLYDFIDREAVEQAIRDARGVPVRVGTIPAAPREAATSAPPS